MKQRIHDLVTGELTLDYFMRRSAEGWKLASVDWVREDARAEDAADAAGTAPLFPPSETSVPYGLRVSERGEHLEENSVEATVLLLILDQIVKEKRMSEIAVQLNRAGYSTRDGAAWSPTAVFNLLPRLIEVGPAVLKSAAWQQRRGSASIPN